MTDALLETDITGMLGPDFMRNLERELRLEVPKEKIRHYQIATKRIKEEQYAGLFTKHVDGLGERVGSVPLRTYFRWDQAERGCWGDKAFREKFFKDNPECRGKI
jgi:hypothetical protein